MKTAIVSFHGAGRQTVKFEYLNIVHIVEKISRLK